MRIFRGEAQLAVALLELCAQPGGTSSHVIVQVHVCTCSAWHVRGTVCMVCWEAWLAYALHHHMHCTALHVHAHVHCTSQDFARNDFELRQFIVGGKVEHRVYSNFAWVDADGYMREFVMKVRTLLGRPSRHTRSPWLYLPWL